MRADIALLEGEGVEIAELASRIRGVWHQGLPV
ncbi:hypothetical protein FB384_002414 [Prauserella sediminis]|uniref:Uncharacterized protein n=1 Tax=Prauserella sediminis TaxID=577680 RepID=A0A839XJN5_9PSEU|nr:hypothetical protein [Prauserella sediminis]